MKRYLVMVLVAAGLCQFFSCAGRTKAQLSSFPHEHADVPVEATVQWGRLTNGITYAIMPNDEPKNRVSIRLMVMSGSLQETEEQRGLAHYLEHMAFNGGAHFPPGTLVENLQRMGLGFGRDTNAHTSFDETVYKLDLPDVKPETISTGLNAMADFAGGMLLVPEEVEHERGVILAEMRDRDTPAFRRWQAFSNARYHGLLIPQRIPIGLQSTVTHATQASLKSYYDNWYRPERMAIAVVGAIGPTQIAAELQTRFSGLVARHSEPHDPDFGHLSGEACAFAIHHDAHVEGTVIAITHTRVENKPDDSKDTRRAALIRDIGENIIKRRFQDLIALAPDGPLIGVDVNLYYWLDVWHADLDAQIRPGRTVAAIPLLEQELRRFMRFGPTVTEMDALRADQRSQLEDAAAKMSSRVNATLAGALVSSLKERQVFCSPVQERDFLLPVLKQITAEDVRISFNSAWSGGLQNIVVSSSEAPADNAEAQLRQAWTDSKALAVKAPVCKPLGLWAYGSDWQPFTGKIPEVQDQTGTREQALGIQRRQVGNVTVLVKKTDFKAEEIQVRLRFDIKPEARPGGAAELASEAFIAGGLKKHTLQDIRDIFSGSTVLLQGPRINDDSVSFAATCRPKDFTSCVQRLRAYIGDPGWRPDAENTAKAAWLEQLVMSESDLDYRVTRAFEEHVVGGIAWRRAAHLDEATAINFAQTQIWLDPILKNAPLTVVVVGDVNIDMVFKEIFSAFSLPLRTTTSIVSESTAVTLADAPAWKPAQVTVDVPGTVARSLIVMAWPTDDFYDVHRTRCLNLLAHVFTELLRQQVREKLGDAYSPRATHTASETWKGQGYLQAEVGVSPDKVEEAKAAIVSIANTLVNSGVSDDLLAHVKPPIINAISVMQRQNVYWAERVLLRAAAQPFRLDWATTVLHDYQAIQAQELSDLARLYLHNDRIVQVIGTCHGK